MVLDLFYRFFTRFSIVFQGFHDQAHQFRTLQVQSTAQRRAEIGATLAEYAEDAPGRVREAVERGVALGAVAAGARSGSFQQIRQFPWGFLVVNGGKTW